VLGGLLLVVLLLFLAVRALQRHSPETVERLTGWLDKCCKRQRKKKRVSMAPERRPTLTGGGGAKPQSLDSLLGADEDSDDDDTVELRLRSKSMPLRRLSEAVQDKLHRKSLVKLKAVGDADVAVSIEQANVRDRWAGKSPDKIRLGLLKLEEKASTYNAKAQRASEVGDVANQAEWESMRARAERGVEWLREMLREKEGDDTLLANYREKDMGAIAEELEELQGEIEDAMHEPDAGGRREKRVSIAMKKAELVEEAIAKKAEQKRARRATLT
jgi:hypothetical protein